MTPVDPLLSNILREMKETRSDLHAADVGIRESIDALADRVKIQNGRIGRLEIDVAEHKAAQAERFLLRREVFVFVWAFICGAFPTILIIFLSR
jgi:hypothetical protein